MEFIYILAVGCSVAVLFVIYVHAAKKPGAAGTKAFLLQIVLVTIWSVGALMEMVWPEVQGMLFWRNFEQIGIFLLPVSCVYFSVEYTHYDRMKKAIPFLLIVPVIALVLIFTDSATHIMRSDYVVSYSPLFGKALSVNATSTGKAFVAYNFMLAFVSLIILFNYSRRVSNDMKRQLYLIQIAMGLIIVFGILKTALLEGTAFNLPIVTMYLPTSLILYYNLYRNNFLYVSPLARDKVFDVIDQGIVVTDILGRIVDKNAFAEQLLSLLFEVREELLGKQIVEIFAENPDWVDFIQNGVSGELELKTSYKSPHYINIKVYPLLSHKGKPVGSVYIIRDTTSLRLYENELKIKAETDSLTGLLNRNGVLDMFSRILNETEINGEYVSVLVMDLDKFKWINDTFGHASGDRVIRAFAKLLTEVLRRKDAVGRLGGDEFVAILPGVGSKEALEIAQRILEIAKERVVRLEDGTDVHLTLSIGICDNEVVKPADEMIKCADKAMYIAKDRGRNSCVVWE